MLHFALMTHILQRLFLILEGCTLLMIGRFPGLWRCISEAVEITEIPSILQWRDRAGLTPTSPFTPPVFVNGQDR